MHNQLTIITNIKKIYQLIFAKQKNKTNQKTDNFAIQKCTPRILKKTTNSSLAYV